MTPEYILSRLGNKNEKTDHMVWVGKDYSIADLKKDLRLIDDYYKNLYTRKPVPIKDLPTVDELWEQAYQSLSDSIDADVVKECKKNKIDYNSIEGLFAITNMKE